MAFNDLQMKVTSEFALQSLHAKLEPISDFTHNFRELEDRKGASIVVPTFALSSAAEFNASTNNYFGGVNEVDSAVINLNKHYVKSLKITDRDLAETEIQWMRDGGTAIGDALGRSLYNYTIGMINAENCPLSAEFSASPTKANFADLFATVYDNNMDISETILMLSPTVFAKLLGTLDANIYGGIDAVRGGRIPGLYGFKAVVCAPNLPESAKGALVDRNSIGMAMRYLAPMEGAYVASWKSSDPISGCPIGFRLATNLATGERFLAGEFIAGVKVIRPTGVVRLV